MAPKAKSGMTAAQIRALVKDEVAKVFADAIPDMVASLRDQVEATITERFTAMQNAGGQGRTREFLYRDFSACSPPEFKGVADPIISMRWISDVEGVFLTSGCPDGLRVRYASNLLRGPAKDWWKTWTAVMVVDEIAAITWEDFIIRFKQQFVPRVEVEKISRDFLSLEQTTETIPEMNRKFTEMALFCPQYAANEEMKMTRYVDMLRTEIREFVATTPYTSLEALMEAARRREIELETQARKRKATQVWVSSGSSAKKPKAVDTRSSQRSYGTRSQGETTKKVDVRCYKCGKEGHMSRECESAVKVCYNCGKMGHIRPDCPDLKRGGGGGAPRAPATAPLRITDGRAGQARPPVTRARVHQLTAEEAQSTPAVVTGILSLSLVLFVLFQPFLSPLLDCLKC